jgi:hypothetical protein
MGTLVIVPCGKLKIWSKNPLKGSIKAKEAYIGSPFKVNKNYAERFSDKWLILSAKYGLITPDFTINGDYNVTFNDPSTNPISIQELTEQAKIYHEYSLVVALGGRRYTDIISRIFSQEGIKVIKPTEGLGLGKSMAKLKNAIVSGKPFQ